MQLLVVRQLQSNLVLMAVKHQSVYLRLVLCRCLQYNEYGIEVS